MVQTQKSQETGNKFTVTDCSNFEKRCSGAHLVSFLFYCYCKVDSYALIKCQIGGVIIFIFISETQLHLKCCFIHRGYLSGIFHYITLFWAYLIPRALVLWALARRLARAYRNRYNIIDHGHKKNYVFFQRPINGCIEGVLYWCKYPFLTFLDK